MRKKLTDSELDAGLSGLTGWSVEGGQSIEKDFKFTTFAEGIAFVNRVARAADAMDHHPDIDIRYTTIHLSLSTHSAGGITASDLALARQIDAAVKG